MLPKGLGGLLIGMNLLWLISLYYPMPIWWLDNLLSYPVSLMGANALFILIAICISNRGLLIGGVLGLFVQFWLLPSPQNTTPQKMPTNSDNLQNQLKARCSSPFTVIQFNALYENTDYNRLLNLLLQEQADLVVLQEVAPALEDKLSTLDDIYPYIYGGKTHAKVPSSQFILSKKAILNFSVEPFTEKNKILQGEWQVTPQTSLHLIATHLPSPRSPTLWTERNTMLTHVETLANKALNANVLVLGDFNLSSMNARFRSHFSEFETRPVASWPEWLTHYP
ncbi:MAG: endonuclease/exonuclease/phosphatase family protein, partial [Vibrio sp.]